MLRRLLRAGVVLGLFALVGGCFSFDVDEATIFMPKRSITPESFDVAGADLEELYFEADDGTPINAWHITRPDSRGTVLFFGGNGFYLVQSRSFIELITSFDVDLFMMDYRGYGRSGGSPGVRAVKKDGVAAYELLTGRFDVPPEDIVVHGHSLGTFLTTHVASIRDVAGVVLQNPATNVHEWIRYLVPWYVRLFVRFNVAPPLTEDDNAERIRTIRAPTLVGGGKADRITDWRMAREIFEESPAGWKRLVILDDAEHNELHTTPEFREAYGKLLQRALAN